jgi:glutamate-5-semialdehyde dehydrogenase
MRARLLLNPERVASMATGVCEVVNLPGPVGETLAEWTRPSGLRIRKVRVPLGVVGLIYESRPNVTVDTVSLALKTGNAIVLRGGKEAARSNERLVEIMNGAAGVPPSAIELLDAIGRDSVCELIKARGMVNVLIPRGGPGLILFVTENAGDRSRELPHLRGRIGGFRNGRQHCDQCQDTMSVSVQCGGKTAGASEDRGGVHSAGL